MTFLSVLELMNYALVLGFGLFLSVFITGGWQNDRQRNLIFGLYPALFVIQGVFWVLFGVETVEMLYPLITHLPLVLILVWVLKKNVGMALVGVCTAYLCCQLPHWVKLAVTALSDSALAGQIGYTLCIVPLFFTLKHWFAGAAHSVMTYSKAALTLFGSLPLAYYVFDYVTFVYSEALQVNTQLLGEFLPTALIIFYVVFLTAYHLLVRKQSQAELQRSMLEAELEQAETEMENLRRGALQTAVYRHDFRHHLNMLETLLAAGNPQKVHSYIQKVQSDMDAVTLPRYCENETVNLLCASFVSKAGDMGAELKVSVKLPAALPISDTELCSIISNGLENALHAVSDVGVEDRKIDFYSEIKHGKLLIQIRNPYAGEIVMQDDLPVTNRPGHGFGCQSIRSITQKHQGLCEFEPKDGIFTLRVVLPAEE